MASAACTAAWEASAAPCDSSLTIEHIAVMSRLAVVGSGGTLPTMSALSGPGPATSTPWSNFMPKDYTNTSTACCELPGFSFSYNLYFPLQAHPVIPLLDHHSTWTSCSGPSPKVFITCHEHVLQCFNSKATCIYLLLRLGWCYAESTQNKHTCRLSRSATSGAHGTSVL